MEDAQRNLICHHTRLQPTHPPSLALPQVVPSPYTSVPLPLFPCLECLTSNPQFSASLPCLRSLVERAFSWPALLETTPSLLPPPQLCARFRSPPAEVCTPEPSPCALNPGSGGTPRVLRAQCLLPSSS